MHNVHTKKHQKAADLRKHRARGGTRTGFQSLQTLGSRRNIGSPGQSGTGTAQSETQSVDTVHTPDSPHQRPPPNSRTPLLRIKGLPPTAAPRIDTVRRFFALNNLIHLETFNLGYNQALPALGADSRARPHRAPRTESLGSGLWALGSA